MRCIGEMAERSNAAVLKTVDCNRSGGSNPSFSATIRSKPLKAKYLQGFFIFGCRYGCRMDQNGVMNQSITVDKNEILLIVCMAGLNVFSISDFNSESTVGSFLLKFL